jgi:hypothetical protein
MSVAPIGVEGVAWPVYVFARHGDGREASPDGLPGAGVSGRRYRSAYAGQHGSARYGCPRRHGGWVRRPATSLHRPNAELHRSSRLRHSVCPSGLASLGRCRIRVDTTRLRPRAAITIRNIPQTRALATDPHGLRPLFSLHQSAGSIEPGGREDLSNESIETRAHGGRGGSWIGFGAPVAPQLR